MKGLFTDATFSFYTGFALIVNACSQANPDRGNDPVEPLDSIKEAINSMRVMTGEIEVKENETAKVRESCTTSTKILVYFFLGDRI